MMSFWVVPLSAARSTPFSSATVDVEAEQPGGGGVDRHRGVHLVERDAVEERVHVALVGDRDADLADLAAGEDVVGVVAGLRRQVEGDREAGLALGEVAPVELVRAPGVGMPGVGAHHPGAVGLGRGGASLIGAHSAQDEARDWVRLLRRRGAATIDTMHLGRDRVIAAHLVARADRRPGPGVGARATGSTTLDEPPRALLLTHIHLDHAGATGVLVAPLPRAARLRQRGRRAAPDRPREAAARAPARLYGEENMERLWGEVAPVPEANVIALAGGEEVEGFRVEHVPGHASHHLCWLDLELGDAYVGDMAGVRIPPCEFTLAPTPPPEIDVEAWLDRSTGSRRCAPERLRLTHFGAADDPGAQLDRVRESLRRKPSSPGDGDARRSWPRSSARSTRRPIAGRGRSLLPGDARPSSSGSASSATGASGAPSRDARAMKFRDRTVAVAAGVRGCSAATLPRARRMSKLQADTHSCSPSRRRPCWSSALARPRSPRSPSTTTTSRAGRSSSEIIRSGGGKRVRPQYREKSKAMLASVKRSPTTCSFRPPVQGDDELPNHAVRVDGKILKKTPKSVRGGAFIEVTVRAGGSGIGYSLRIFPQKQRFELRRGPAGGGFPAQGKNDAIKKINERNSARAHRHAAPRSTAPSTARRSPSVDDDEPGPGRGHEGPLRARQRQAEEQGRRRRPSSGSRSRSRTLSRRRERPWRSTTETLERPRTRRPGSGLGGNWQVIVLNDDHNTFDHVARTLAAVIPGRHARPAATGSPTRSTAAARRSSGPGRGAGRALLGAAQDAGLTMAPLESH